MISHILNIRWSILFMIVFLSFSSYAQEGDSIAISVKDKLNKPIKAALLSAALPGAGQIYNKKAWQLKVPIIYAGGVGMAYFIRSNHAEYRFFREAFVLRNDGNPETNPSSFFDSYTDDNLLRVRDRYRRDRDYAVILSLLWYVINVAEATTTAHLNDFDVSDDLSFRFRPQLDQINGNPLAGVSLVIGFPTKIKPYRP